MIILSNRGALVDASWTWTDMQIGREGRNLFASVCPRASQVNQHISPCHCLHVTTTHVCLTYPVNRLVLFHEILPERVSLCTVAKAPAKGSEHAP